VLPGAVLPAPIPDWLLGLMLASKAEGDAIGPRRSQEQRTIDGLTGYRNNQLFTVARLFAYRTVPLCSDEVELQARVQRYTARRNSLFPLPLDGPEVSKIVKSVTTRVWPYRDYFVELSGNRAVLELPPMPWFESAQEHHREIHHRQRQGALHSADRRRSKNNTRIAAAVAGFQRRGERITINAVAHIAGLSRQTVWRHVGGLSGLAKMIEIPEIRSRETDLEKRRLYIEYDCS